MRSTAEIIYDSCVIRDLYRKKVFVGDIKTMWFQKYQLPAKVKRMYKFQHLRKFEKQNLKSKDDNFLLLDKSQYCVITYDKLLKKKLKAHKYKVYASLSELQDLKENESFLEF